MSGISRDSDKFIQKSRQEILDSSDIWANFQKLYPKFCKIAQKSANIEFGMQTLRSQMEKTWKSCRSRTLQKFNEYLLTNIGFGITEAEPGLAFAVWVGIAIRDLELLTQLTWEAERGSPARSRRRRGRCTTGGHGWAMHKKKKQISICWTWQGAANILRRRLRFRREMRSRFDSFGSAEKNIFQHLEQSDVWRKAGLADAVSRDREKATGLAIFPHARLRSVAASCWKNRTIKKMRFCTGKWKPLRFCMTRRQQTKYLNGLNSTFRLHSRLFKTVPLHAAFLYNFLNFSFR